MKKILPLFGVLIGFLVSCQWFRNTSELGDLLARNFKNKIYLDFDTADYHALFRLKLDTSGFEPLEKKVIFAYYQNHGMEPMLIKQHYFRGSLDSLADYVLNSRLHGLNPEHFGYRRFSSLLDRFSANGPHSIAEVYESVADLELQAARSLIRYHSLIAYGGLNPRKLIFRYYIPVARPDSSTMAGALASDDLVKLLNNIQPKSADYLALSRELKALSADSTGKSGQVKSIVVNMERLRWRLPALGEEYVEVNIPDFSLTWFLRQDTIAHMKVCVGEPRPKDYRERLNRYLESGILEDKPGNHETSILLSSFNAVQVNPIWNIPVSIARSEIYHQALRDPYYLSNNNIRVYQGGKLVADPDTIIWSHYAPGRLPFQFKQGSGDGNALGKFKFVFDNRAGIYLHDTNNKSGFKLSNRAISHGCVRVEDPLRFAENLIGDKRRYDELRMEVNLPPLDTGRMSEYVRKMERKSEAGADFKLRPSWFGLKKQVPILINYRTAWLQNGHLEYRPDVYHLDETLWDAMKKFM